MGYGTRPSPETSSIATIVVSLDPELGQPPALRGDLYVSTWVLVYHGPGHFSIQILFPFLHVERFHHFPPAPCTEVMISAATAPSVVLRACLVVDADIVGRSTALLANRSHIFIPRAGRTIPGFQPASSTPSSRHGAGVCRWSGTPIVGDSTYQLPGRHLALAHTHGSHGSRSPPV